MRRLAGDCAYLDRSGAQATWVARRPQDGAYLILRLLNWQAAVGVRGDGLPKYELSIAVVSPDLVRSSVLDGGEPEFEAASLAAQAKYVADSGWATLIWSGDGNDARRLLAEARARLALAAGAEQGLAPAA